MTKKLESQGNKPIIGLAYLLGLAHLVFGITKLAGLPNLTKEFTEIWAFPLWFMYFVGVAQILGGVALFIRILRMPASFAMALIMVGAITTTIISGQIGNAVLCFVIMVLCLVVFVARLKDLAIELAIEQGYSKQ